MIPRYITTALPAAQGLALSILALALAACGAVPPVNPALQQARQRFDSASGQAQVAALAAPELSRAREALDKAVRANQDGADLDTVDHLAYMARQHVVVAEETARSRAAQAVTAQAGADRDSLRLAQRTEQADQAERRLGAAERDNARQRSELARSEAGAMAERSRLIDSDARLKETELQLKALNARQTARGIVVTLGDLLFASGQSQLQDAGLHSVGQLADFLKRNPSRVAVIEGYTDSQGGADFNQALSDRRAHAVMDALLQQGVAAQRLSTQAYGEGRPVADNATASGRQMNRRVEVVFAAEAGDVLLK